MIYLVELSTKLPANYLLKLLTCWGLLGRCGHHRFEPADFLRHRGFLMLARILFYFLIWFHFCSPVFITSYRFKFVYFVGLVSILLLYFLKEVLLILLLYFFKEELPILLLYFVYKRQPPFATIDLQSFPLQSFVKRTNSRHSRHSKQA